MAFLTPRSFWEALTAPGGGWEIGRRRRKYIFKDNLEANIIFILIYPQSSLARPQTCLMSRNCKMAMSPTCLPLQTLLAGTRTRSFQLCDRCRQNGCKEHRSARSERLTPRGREPQNCQPRKMRCSRPLPFTEHRAARGAGIHMHTHMLTLSVH